MFYNDNDAFEFLQQSEAMNEEVSEEYELNRKYYEHLQVPDDVPSEIAYYMRNKVFPFVNRQVSMLVGGTMTKTFLGQDEQVLPLERLVDRTLAENNFFEHKMERGANRFMVEGLAGWKVDYNPFRSGPRGLGDTKIHALNPLNNEIFLDPNTTDGTHESDRARAFRYSVPIQQAKRNIMWRDHWAKIVESANERNNVSGGVRMVDVYEVEFRHTFYTFAYYDPELDKFFPLQRFVSIYDPEYEGAIDGLEGDMIDDEPEYLGEYVEDDRAISKVLKEMSNPNIKELNQILEHPNVTPVEVEKYFRMVVINKEIVVEPPEPSGFNGFTICVACHTPREYETLMPISPTTYLRDSQDRINTTISMMHQEAQSALKNATVIRGSDYDTFMKFKRKISGIGEVFFVPIGADLQIEKLQPSEMSPILLQQLQLEMETFDDTGNTNAVAEGKPVDLSGKAMNILGNNTNIPMYVSIVRFSNGVKEVVKRILEASLYMMDRPFHIMAEIDGKNRQIFFNSSLEKAGNFDPNQNYITDTGVNVLREMEMPDIQIEIEPNYSNKQDIEIQKAVMMFDRQALSLQDLHRAVFPKRWTNTLQQAIAQSAALQMMEAIKMLSPEAQQAVGEQIQAMAVAEAVQQQQEQEQLQKGQQNGQPAREG